LTVARLGIRHLLESKAFGLDPLGDAHAANHSAAEGIPLVWPVAGLWMSTRCVAP
jgi:hypothetical protein